MGATSGNIAAARDEGQSRVRWWLFRAIAGCVPLFGIGAVILSYYLYEVEMMPHGPTVRVTGDPLIQWDDEIGYAPALNSDTELHHFDSNARYHVFTDRLGARVDHLGDQTPDRVDIMTVGCSFSFALGIDNEDSYTEQLMPLVGAIAANFAVGGYSSIQSLQMLRRHIDLRPKVVIYGFIPAHLQRNVSPCAPSFAPFCVSTSYFQNRGDGASIHPPPPRLVGLEPMLRELARHDPYNLAQILRVAVGALRSDLFRYIATRSDAYDESPENMAAGVRFAVAEMARATRSIGSQLFVVYIPYMKPGEAVGPPESVLQAVAEAGVPFVDLSPAIGAFEEQYPDQPLSRTPDDGHPNALAHRIIAERLAVPLREQLGASGLHEAGHSAGLGH